MSKTAKEILTGWYEGTSQEDVKEIYENLMDDWNFLRFLTLLQEYRDGRRAWAQGLAKQSGQEAEVRFLLGSAQAVDDIIDSMREFIDWGDDA